MANQGKLEQFLPTLFAIYKKMIPDKRKQGFTLIELLVSMLIISVLAGIALVSFLGAQKTSRDGRRKADLEQIRSALEMYRSDQKQYPAALASLVSTYLSAVPADPLGGSYTYSYSRPTVSTFVLCSYSETNQSQSYADCGGNCGATCYYKTTNP